MTYKTKHFDTPEQRIAHEWKVAKRLAARYIARGFTPEEGGKRIAELNFQHKVREHKRLMLLQNPMCGVRL